MIERIVCSNSDIQRISNRGTTSIRWADISEVHIYRLDAITHEAIYVAVQHISGHTLELRDDMGGWDELIEALASRVSRPVADLRSRILNQRDDDELIILYPGDA